MLLGKSKRKKHLGWYRRRRKHYLTNIVMEVYCEGVLCIKALRYSPGVSCCGCGDEWSGFVTDIPWFVCEPTITRILFLFWASYIQSINPPTIISVFQSGIFSSVFLPNFCRHLSFPMPAISREALPCTLTVFHVCEGTLNIKHYSHFGHRTDAWTYRIISVP